MWRLYARYNYVIDGHRMGVSAALYTRKSFNNFNGHDAHVAFIKNRKATNQIHMKWEFPAALREGKLKERSLWQR